jgi:tetratricopeptide (TPR) repeat protein
MALGQGQAFITVEADLRPFAKELNRQVPLILREAEKAAKDAASKTMGKAGEAGGKSFDRAFKANAANKGTFTTITASLAEALDDGISALPAEVKAALILGIIAALPVVAALLTGAISGALILGFAGIGTLIAFQFEEVRDEGAKTLTELRNRIVSAGSAFVAPVLGALESIGNRLGGMETSFRSLFAIAARFIEPVVDALFSFVDAALPGLEAALGNIEELLPTLIEGAQFLGQAIGESLEVITESEGAEESLITLIGLTGDLILFSATLIRAFTDLYDIIVSLTLLDQIIGADQVEGVIRMKGAQTELVEVGGQVIAVTKAEEKAIKEQEKAIKDAKKALDAYVDAQFSYVDAEIAFERALDDLSEAVKEHGKSLDIDSEKGRKVSETILRGLKAAREEREAAVASGRLTEAEAEAQFQKEVARLRKRAIELGIVSTAYDELANRVSEASAAPLDLKLSPTTKHNIRVITDLINRYLATFGFKAKPVQTGGERVRQQYADGGIVSTPTVALVGEAGPEAVVPLTRPQRAAQVMAEAGLGSGGDVYVYVGNEQLDSRMFRVARGTQRQQAKRLYAGTRSGF